ncbi:MAG TPA: HAD family phosphatase [Ilumatobacteraceae bacterium]
MLLPATPARLPEGLVFDLDGTIVDTESVEFGSIREVWAEHGMDYTLAHFEHVIGTTSGPDWIRELGAALGSAVDGDALLKRRRVIQMEMLASLAPRDGVVALIEEAAASGVPMAIASNSPLYWVRDRLRSAGLSEHFAALVAIDTASRPKPEPEPYLEACAALGVTPAHTAAFEDSVVGIRAAVAAGLYTVACAGPLTQRHDLSAADLVITSHTDITLGELDHLMRERLAPDTASTE